MAADVQELAPDHRITLNRVGVTGIRKLIVRRRGGEENALAAHIEVFIDLNPTKKGIHMSRCTDTINEVIEEGVEHEVADVEQFCTEVASRLLERHPEATRTEVHLAAEYPLDRTSPVSGRRSQEMYTLVGRAVARRTNGDISTRRTIGVEVEGMLACPCAQEMMRETSREVLVEAGMDDEAIDKVLGRLPIATHNQRGRAELTVGLAKPRLRVEADTLIDIVEDAFSSPVFEVLKRPDEAHVVSRAHRRPRFVEDAVRSMVGGVTTHFPELPDGALVAARMESMESIHRHNAVAECTATLGLLRAQLEGEDHHPAPRYHSLNEWMR